MNIAACLRDLADVPTPALVLLGDRLDRNIDAMRQAADAGGRALRPHAKTHKCVEIARRQLAAGARGICCATMQEMEALAAAGIGRLLLTAPIADAPALRRLAALHRREPISMVCDHPAQIDAILSVREPDDPVLPVFVDVDVGQRRTGVVDPAQGLALARRIASEPGLAFAGLQGFAGNAQHIADARERRAAAQAAAHRLAELSGLLEAEGIAVPDITGSGTGAFDVDMGGVYTELQVGSYVFMDADYAGLDHAAAAPFGFALFVMASVVSVNRPGEITVNAGTKALAVNGPPPHLILGVADGASYRFAGDEHGIVTLPPGAVPPPPGARVLLVATHCDPTVNLHDRYHVWRESGSVEQWRVTGRYGS